MDFVYDEAVASMLTNIVIESKPFAKNTLGHGELSLISRKVKDI